MDDIEIHPSKDSLILELSLLYLKNQDLSGKTPIEIFDLYWKAKDEFFNELKKKNAGKHTISYP